MLRRSVAVILIMLYISTVSGFALNLHYCFNRLSSVKIDAPAKDCTNSCGTGKMKCCHDKHIEVKVKDVHQSGFFSFSGKVFIADVPIQVFADSPLTLQPSQSSKLTYRGPPPQPDITIFLRNCAFRI